MDQECEEEEGLLKGMEDEVHDANDMAEQEESICSVPDTLFSGAKPKRLRSKVWADFTPIFIDSKVARAECMHCHQVYNINSSSGTSNLLKHQAKCNPRAQKRPMQQKLHILPSTQKSIIEVGSGLTQKKLPFLLTSQNICPDKADVTPDKKVFALLNNLSNTNRKSQEIDQNASHEELITPEKNNLALPDTSSDKDGKNQSHKEHAVLEQSMPTDTDQKNPENDQSEPHEELVRIFAVHGYPPSIKVHDRFRKLVTCLNPMVKMPAEVDMYVYFTRKFDKEKAKLKEKFAALRSRVCLSAYVWHYDSLSVFLCLTVHYINDEWEKQKHIITFHAVDPSCNAKQLSQSISYAIGDWGLRGKVFSITLDDTFADDSIASEVKASFEECNFHLANRSLSISSNQSLFVTRYATHLVNQVIQMGKDELDKVIEKSAKYSKCREGCAPSLVQYPNYRYKLSPEAWHNAKNICEILEDLHRYRDEIHNCGSPVDLFDSVWGVKKFLHRDANFYFWGDKTIFSELKEMQEKFKEYWKLCCLNICMPMIMDPSYSLRHIKSCLWRDASNYYLKRKFDDDIEDYIQEVHDILLNLFYEYSEQVGDTNCTSGSKTSKRAAVKGDDTLMKYYHVDEYPYFKRPMTELDLYLQESGLPADERSVLQWWKENSLNYPTMAWMARDILAIPQSTDCDIATRTPRRTICESSERWIEMLVCIQDWLRADDYAREMCR